MHQSRRGSKRKRAKRNTLQPPTAFWQPGVKLTTCHKDEQRSAHEKSFHCPSGAKKATRPGQGIVRVCRWKHLQTLRLDRTQAVPHNCKQEVWVRSPNLTLRRPDKTLRARACHIPRGPLGSVFWNYGFGSTFEIFWTCSCGSVFEFCDMSVANGSECLR